MMLLLIKKICSFGGGSNGPDLNVAEPDGGIWLLGLNI
jgi:hypothetical protein